MFKVSGIVVLICLLMSLSLQSEDEFDSFEDDDYDDYSPVQMPLIRPRDQLDKKTRRAAISEIMIPVKRMIMEEENKIKEGVREKINAFIKKHSDQFNNK